MRGRFQTKSFDRLQRQVDKNPQRAAVIGAVALTSVLLADGITLATHSSDAERQHLKTEKAVTRTLTAEQIRLAAQKAAALKIRERTQLITRLAAQVPPATYAGALATSRGNLVATEQRIIAYGLPPVPIPQAVSLGKPLHVSFSKSQQVQANKLVNRWGDLVQSHRIKPNLAPRPASIFKAYTPNQEAQTRARIAHIMDSELRRNVHEVPDNTNHGPRVDFYTGYKYNHFGNTEWCGGWDSSVYMLAGLPLSGGHKYSRLNPDYLLLRAAEPARLNENPRIPSVSDWFKDNAYYFRNGARTPATGDAVFMHYQDAEGHEQWHTGLVRDVTANGSLVTYEGNVGNALVRKVYPDFATNSYIYGFGSFFPAEQEPHSVPASPVPNLLLSPEPAPSLLPTPLPELIQSTDAQPK